MIDFEFAPDEFSAPSSRAAATASPASTAYLGGLNDRQREAAEITEGPLIVLAGAGSGKTKMLTTRIAHLMNARGVPGYQILAMTFTNKAAGEMRERVDKILQNCDIRAHGGLFARPEIGTFHSVCVRILRREMPHLPFTKPFVIYDDSDQLSLIKSVLAKLQIDEKQASPKGIQSAINRAKCDALEPADLQPSPHNLFEKNLKRAYEQYQKDLFANNALDFGEILCLTYRLFRDNEGVRAAYQRRFRYIHVDEYQDTNRAQYLLLSVLAQKAHGGLENICVVGDEDQSIYKWRGADIRNILDFERDYPGAQVVKLEQNYRSTQTIIKAAGRVISNNSSRKDKTLWTANPAGEKIVRFQLPDERAEAEISIGELKRLARDDGRSYGDFAIFYRTNAQSRQFEDVLRREKIPYQIVGGLRFYDRKEIKDVLAYFRVILNPADSVSFRRIINTPARGIGKTTIEKVDSAHEAAAWNTPGTPRAYGETLRQVASDPSLTSAGTAKKLAGFVQLLDKLVESQSKLMLSELYHMILDETGYVRELRAEDTEEAAARIENLEEFDTLLQEFEEDQFHSIPEGERKITKADLLALFIEQSSLASDTDKVEDTSAVVKMMTLHSSKGLEFPVVFMAGMEEGLFPSVKAWEEEDPADVEEERRLCYVGMTRARERLFLMNVIVRRLWGTANYHDASRFFDEMPSDLIEMRDFTKAISATAGRGFSFGGGAPRREASDFFSRRTASSDDDFDQTPRYSESAVARDLVGRKIRHPEYGKGTIIASEGSGDDRKVTIEFAAKSHRKFLFRYVAAYLET